MLLCFEALCYLLRYEPEAREHLPKLDAVISAYGVRHAGADNRPHHEAVSGQSPLFIAGRKYIMYQYAAYLVACKHLEPAVPPAHRRT